MPTKRLMRHVFEVPEMTIENRKNELIITEEEYDRFLVSFPALHDYFEGTWVDDEGEIFGHGICFANDMVTCITAEEIEAFEAQYKPNAGKRDKLLSSDRKSLDILEWFYSWTTWAFSNSIRPGCHYFVYWDNNA